MIEPSLPFDEEPITPESRIDARDRAGRERAVDPRFNVALEASAGTGKTRILDFVSASTCVSIYASAEFVVPRSIPSR